MSEVVTDSRIAFQFDAFKRHPVRHALSGRIPGVEADGDVGHGPNTIDVVIERNRRAFIESAGFSMSDLVISRQTHGTCVQVVEGNDRGRGLFPAFDGFPATDAMVTNDPSVALGTIVADCVPILLYDPRRHAIGLAHAGWRGTVGRIAAETVRTMTEAFGTVPDDVVAGIGPSIGPCCYEVGRDVIDAWSESEVPDLIRAVSQRSTGYHFDLWAANRLVLVHAGVPDQQIEYSAYCVRCEHERFFSYRATRQI
ncbi:MAG TPA: peptidoglycan editing factor PgeF, partial [Thermomicrobiales bacterium]|nr:peptidoglycan editing factor PgeF [Thermomicrobiales bacterium]